jgi:rubrerythrin
MTQEQETTRQALQVAIKMEIDGKEFYQKAAKASGNPLGKKLLNRLADEEDIHRQVFQNIYNTLGTQKGWPKADLKHGSVLSTLMKEAADSIGKDIKPGKQEIDDVKLAMDMENKTYDYYRTQAAKAAYPAEKEFYERLVVQEEEHHKILLSYFEFLNDPEAWFVQMEHPSLDG